MNNQHKINKKFNRLRRLRRKVEWWKNSQDKAAQGHIFFASIAIKELENQLGITTE